jgi:DNA-binding transcriptional MocR family regulator
MSLWVDLPPVLNAELLRRRVTADQVDFLPGGNFSSDGSYPASLRLSFGGLTPHLIERGIEILGAAASAELGASAASTQFEWAAAVV